MKTLLLLLLPFGIAFAEPAAPAKETAPAPAAAPLKIKKLPRLETKERYVFTNVEILEKLPDGLYIRVGNLTPPKTARVGDGDESVPTFIVPGGTTLVPYESLPAALIKQIGGFNAGEARKAREARKEDWKQGGQEFSLGYGREGDNRFAPYDPKEDAR